MTNPSTGLDLPYFRGKAHVEDMLRDLGVPYGIIRPTLVFGDGDLLLNNMAWALRRFPIFPIYGNGDYAVQPIYVEDLAAQAVEAGSQSESSVADAAGPKKQPASGRPGAGSPDGHQRDTAQQDGHDRHPDNVQTVCLDEGSADPCGPLDRYRHTLVRWPQHQPDTGCPGQ